LSDIQNGTEKQVGYLELVRSNADFRNLWIGQVISLFGDWFNLIASASLIALLTQSGLAVGGLFVVRMLAQFLASPIGGVLADRFNRKSILIITDLLRAGTVLGFLLVQTSSDVWFLYTLTAIQMALSGIFFPARTAILPDVVSPRELGTANTLSAVTWSTMLAVGAALGGLVAGEWGLRPAFVIDSLTFLLSAFFIGRVKYQLSSESIVDGNIDLNFISEYAEGLRYLNTNRHIISIVLQKASLVISVTSIFQIIQVAISSQVFVMGEGGSTSLGLIYAMVGVGTGVGPLIAHRFTGDNHVYLRRANLVGFLFGAIGLLTISPLLSFGLVLFGTLLRGIGAGLVWVFSTQLLLQLVPSQVRGRVFSTEFAIMTLLSASGAALGGWIFDKTEISITQMLQIMSGAALLLCSLWIASGYLRSKTPNPDQAEPIAEALD